MTRKEYDERLEAILIMAQPISQATEDIIRVIHALNSEAIGEDRHIDHLQEKPHAREFQKDLDNHHNMALKSIREVIG